MSKPEYSKAKYYAFKTLIGNDEDYLPLLDNIVYMSKMTDPKLDNLEAYLIMDPESVAMTQSKLHPSGVSYYDFIQNSGCKVLLVKDLIEKTFPPGNGSREKAIKIYQKLKSYNQAEFQDIPSDLPFEVLSKASEADFIKSLCLGGFYDQHQSSVNICMDLDITQDGTAQLPDNPADFLPGKVAGYDRVISYAPERVDSLSSEEQDQIRSNPEVQEKWSNYKEKVKVVRAHEVFLTEAAAQEISDTYKRGRPIGHGDDLTTARGRAFSFMSQEYATSRAKTFPIIRSLDQAQLFLNQIEQTIQGAKSKITKDTTRNPEAKVRDFKKFLQENRRGFNDQMVTQLYSFFKRENEQSGTGQVVDPSYLGVVGRYSIEKRKSVSTDSVGREDNSAYTPMYIPNINNLEEFRKPFVNFLGSLSTRSPAFTIDDLIKPKSQRIEARRPDTPSTSIYAISAAVILTLGLAMMWAFRRNPTQDAERDDKKNGDEKPKSTLTGASTEGKLQNRNSKKGKEKGGRHND